MKVIILAGGLGTRMAEETELRPKPMVEIGGRPILWHIMKLYAHHGFREFIIALGYRGQVIKQYFLDYAAAMSDISVSTRDGLVRMHDASHEDWMVHLVDTGAETQTGGRVKRLENWVKEETFLLTYGDGVGNIDLKALVAFHESHGGLATVTAVRPPARFGSISFEGDRVARFAEKPQVGDGWINGGFMVLSSGIFGYLEGDQDPLEVKVLERLAAERKLMAYRHDSFWQCMDTLRDKRLLEHLWAGGAAPWKVWS